MGPSERVLFRTGRTRLTYPLVGAGSHCGIAPCGPRRSRAMTTKITREVLEGYLYCKYKAYLKLADQQGSVWDYEKLLVANRQEVRQTAIDKILAKHLEGEVARDITLTAAALRAGPSFV